MQIGGHIQRFVKQEDYDWERLVRSNVWLCLGRYYYFVRILLHVFKVYVNGRCRYSLQRCVFNDNGDYGVCYASKEIRR